MRPRVSSLQLAIILLAAVSIWVYVYHNEDIRLSRPAALYLPPRSFMNNHTLGSTTTTLEEPPEKTLCDIRRLQPNMSIAMDENWLCNPGRLGNKLFTLASLLGIACRHNAQIYLPVDRRKNEQCKSLEMYWDMFPVIKTEIPEVRPNVSSRWKLIKEPNANYMLYTDYKLTAGENYRVTGYLQNWRYFIDIEDTVRNLFTISDKYTWRSREILHQIKTFFASENRSFDPVFVGTHVRRGDIGRKDLVDYGYVMANRTYLEQSFKLMSQRHGHHTIFVVTSDSIDLVEKELEGLQHTYKIYYLKNTSYQIDFTVLTMTNHSIITGGTFGFWAAWMAGGEVITFKDYARPNSTLARLGFTTDAVTFANWTLLGNDIDL